MNRNFSRSGFFVQGKKPVPEIFIKFFPEIVCQQIFRKIPGLSPVPARPRVLTPYPLPTFIHHLSLRKTPLSPNRAKIEAHIMPSGAPHCALAALYFRSATFQSPKNPDQKLTHVLKTSECDPFEVSSNMQTRNASRLI